MLDFVLQDVWLFFFLISFRIIMFSTGLQYLLSTIWTNKEGEPNAGHVTSVAPGDWSSSVLCDLGKQVGIFLKLFIKKYARS